MTRELDEKLLGSLAEARGFFSGNHGRGHYGRDFRREHERYEAHEYEHERHHHEHHEYKKQDVTFAKGRVLGVLLGKEKGMRQKDIAENLRVNASTMSELIDRLEHDGYVVRSVDPSDKRATIIALTELGRARACELEDTQERRLDSMFSNLNDSEKQELIHLLNKLNGTL